MAISRRSAAVVALIALGQASCAAAQSVQADRQSIDQAYAIVDFQTSRSGREIAQALQRHLDRLPMQVSYRQLSVGDAPRSPRVGAIEDADLGAQIWRTSMFSVWMRYAIWRGEL